MQFWESKVQKGSLSFATYKSQLFWHLGNFPEKKRMVDLLA